MRLFSTEEWFFESKGSVPTYTNVKVFNKYLEVGIEIITAYKILFFN